MSKVVYNACYGGFGISRKAILRMIELGSEEAKENKIIVDSYFPERKGEYNSYMSGCCRHDPLLVQVVEELGDEANGSCAKLRIDDIGGSRYRIKEYDGKESIEEAYDDYDWITIK